MNAQAEQRLFDLSAPVSLHMYSLKITFLKRRFCDLSVPVSLLKYIFCLSHIFMENVSLSELSSYLVSANGVNRSSVNRG